MYLNVGSNTTTLDGFVNIDIEPVADVCCDVRWGLPFADASFDGVYSEHFIEHIPQRDAVAFLRECRRVTEVGGRIRIATPDLDWIVDRYQSTDWRTGDMFANGFDWVATRAEQLNIAMREWGHQWLYDEEELCRIGVMAGLELVGRLNPGESQDPAFRGRETRPGSRLVIEFLHARPPVRTEAPLVSILVPAYRARFLEDALVSAVNQTRGDLEIVIGDDCPTAEVRDVVERRALTDPRIRYVRNEPARGARHNYYRLFEESRGDYVKFLNDDDVLHPRAVERMAAVLDAMPRVSLVTSHRRRIAEDGTFLADDLATAPPVSEDCVLRGPNAVASMLGRGVNWIGEPSTTMFRRGDITEAEPELFAFCGRPALANGDVTLWTRLLSRGDLCYLTSSLSLFRQHAGQAQSDPDFRQRALQAWARIAFDAERMGLGGPSVRRLHARGFDLRPWWSAATRDHVLAADDRLSRGAVDDGLRALRDARTSSEGDPSVALLEARLSVALGRHEQALDALDAAAGHDPWDPSVRCEQALVLADAGQVLEARAKLLEAAELAPGSDLVSDVAQRVGAGVRIST